jgi:quinolinate synthase
VIIAHPECRGDVVAMADEVCSTTAMLSAVKKFPSAHTFIVATEHGIVHQLRLRYPDKEFVIADGCIGCRMHCPYMKMIDLTMVRDALVRGRHAVEVPADVAEGARRSLERMIAVPRDA